MSWKAKNSSSSWTFFEGISPRAILQKIQLSLIGVPCSGRGAPCFFFQARQAFPACQLGQHRSEEHTSALQSLMRISYAVFCLKNKTQNQSYTFCYIAK